ncbi:MAG: hypothetical protein JXQ96_11405 [Cyclobacteriaceae bacterium]
MNNSNYTEIYATQHCASYQCDKLNVYYMDLFGDQIKFNACSLISLNQKIKSINLETLLLDPNGADFEVINLSCIDRLFIFSIEQLIELRDLLEGTFAMIMLNSEIHSRIRRNIFA